MSIREKLAKHYATAYLGKYGDRIVQIQGNVISAKIVEKKYLWILNRITAHILVRPERSRSIMKFYYGRLKWFKKPKFIPISQGNLVVITGMKGKKGKKGSDLIQIMNVINLTNKKELIPTKGNGIKKVRKVQRIK